MTNKEVVQTLVLIKPDALKNSLTGYVLSQLSEFHTGLRFAGMKVVCVTTQLAEEHYSEHKGKAFFPALIEYIQGKLHYDNPAKQRVIAIVYQGEEAVQKIRDIAGPTNPHRAREQKPGCVRSLGTVVPILNEKGDMIGDRMDNLIHASATVEEAEREIKIWFKPTDIPPAMRIYPTKKCEDHYYFKDGKLFTTYEPGSFCVFAPGEIVWESDYEALKAAINCKTSAVTVDAVVAKYLTNI